MSGLRERLRAIRFAINALRSLWRQDQTGRRFRRRMLLRGVVVEGPCRAAINGTVEIGPGVVIQHGLALGVKKGGALRIGAGTRIGADATISCAQFVTLGENVLIAARCFIADFGHAYERLDLPVLSQGNGDTMPVAIGADSWLGINVVILPGVTLGRHCVVAANSVVTKSFGSNCVIGGAPARLLRSLDVAQDGHTNWVP